MASFARIEKLNSGAPTELSNSVAETAGLAACAGIRRLKAGETLYVEGDAAPYCFQVIDGVIKEYNTLEDGRRQVADFYRAGDMFGISEVDEHLHTGEAITECAVRCYPRAAYLQAIATCPDLSQRFLSTLMTRLHRARERMIMLGRMNAAQRVATFILRLSDEQATTEKVRFFMSRQDIADHLGLTIETVCRVLTEFKKKQLIDMRTAREFAVADINALDSAASGCAAVH